MPTADDVLNLARSQLGVCEVPLGSNSGTPYHAWYGSFCEGWQWCAIFVSWVIWHVDQALFYGLMTAYSGDYLNVGRMYLREVSLENIAPGDICIWDRPVGGITDHIGFVESVDAASATFTTIEGNSGDCVKRNTHTEEQTSSCHYYFVRPAYSQEQPTQEVDMDSRTFPPALEVHCGAYSLADGDVWVKAQQDKGPMTAKGTISFSTSKAIPFELKPEAPIFAAGAIGNGVPAGKDFSIDVAVTNGIPVRVTTIQK